MKTPLGFPVDAGDRGRQLLAGEPVGREGADIRSIITLRIKDVASEKLSRG